MERAPLDGHRAVAQTDALAGLLLARHLADMGMEVAVIERPERLRPVDRAAVLRNTFSAVPDGPARIALFAAADVVVIDVGAEPPSLSGRAIVVAVPAGLDEGTDLPWLLATAGAGAVAMALYARRKRATGARIELDPEALMALLGLGMDASAAAEPLPGAEPHLDAHLRARGFWEPVGGREIAAPPWVVGGATAHTRRPAPLPGEHTQELERRFSQRRGAGQ